MPRPSPKLSKLSDELRKEIEEKGPLPLEHVAAAYFFTKLTPSTRKVMMDFLKVEPLFETDGQVVTLKSVKPPNLSAMRISETMFAFIDTETTINPGTSQRMIEIGILTSTGMRETGRYSSLFNPDAPITKDVFDLTGISAEDVAKAPRFEQEWPEIENILRDRVVAAHNLSFDMMVLRHELDRAAIPFGHEPPAACTLRFARKLLPKKESCSLDALIYRFDLKADGRHRALPDADLCFQLFFRLIEFAEKEKNKEIKTLQDLKDLGALK